MLSPAPHFDLYAYWRTSAGYRVRVALKLKGMEVTERNVDIDGGEHRTPEFLKINPPRRHPRFGRARPPPHHPIPRHP